MMTRSTAAVLALVVAACGDNSGSVETDAGTEPPECEYQGEPARAARFIAVGHKVVLDEATSAATYRAAIRATALADAVPLLAPDRANVLVFPEDVGLSAVLSGSRGVPGRAEASLMEALVALFDTYGEAYEFYFAIDGLAPLARLLMAATTDTVWRAVDGTFAELAAEHGAWVVTGVNVGDVEVTTDPAAIAVLGDPDRPAGAEVYWVPDARVYNQALYYDPAGALVGKVRKEYLVALELVDGLNLNGGLPERLGPVTAGGLRTTSLISRDAWMPHAVERMALSGAEVVLQLEAFFGGWSGFADGDALWKPDNIKRSSWNAVQKFPELRAAVAPMLVGNFMDGVIDGQSFAVLDGTPADPPRALVGQEPDVGWAAIAPWVIDEPAGTLAERRAALAEVGVALEPGGAMANQYRQGSVFVDVDVPADDGYPVVADATPAPGEPAALGPSRAVAVQGRARQRTAQLIARAGGGLALVWEDQAFCAGQIVVSTSADGVTWSPPVRVQPWNRAQRTPSLVEDEGGALVVAWQEVMGLDRAEIRVSRSVDGGATWSPRTRIDPELGGFAWVPSLTRDDVTGALHLAFVDARADEPRFRLFHTSSSDGGLSFAAARRVDPREFTFDLPDPTYRTEWGPVVRAHAGVVRVLYSHRDRRAAGEQPSDDAYLIESQDGGQSFGAPLALDDGGGPERLVSDLALALDPAGGYLAGWSSTRGADDADVAIRGATGALTRVPDVEPARYQWLPALAPLGDGRFVATWQDLRGGSTDIYLAVWDGAGFGPALRIDDAGASAAQAWRPDVAVLADGRVAVVWEDSRSGFAELRVALAQLP